MKQYTVNLTNNTNVVITADAAVVSPDWLTFLQNNETVAQFRISCIYGYTA